MQKLSYLDNQRVLPLWNEEEILNIQSLLNKSIHYI